MQNSSIHGYLLKYKLGEGGLCEVWYAENYLLKPAAVKILHEQFSRRPDVVSAFENEARVMGQIDHPNICKVYDLGSINGRPAILMEYLNGKDLVTHLYNNSLGSRDQLITWWNQAVDALRYLHQQQIVHRDIKPSNIFLLQSGSIKLIDFGIASLLQGSAQDHTQIQAGSQLYMSPEQVYQRKDISRKTDVYSLATTFYHLVTGKKPYGAEGLSDFEIQESIVNKNIDHTILPQPWRDLLPQYWHKQPEQRGELKPISARASPAESKQAQTMPGFTDPAPASKKVVARPARFFSKGFRVGCWLFAVLLVTGLFVVNSYFNRVKPYIKEVIAWGKDITSSGDTEKKPARTTTPVTRPVPPPTQNRAPVREYPDDGANRTPESDVDNYTKEYQLKELIESYYNLRGDCDKLRFYFPETITQYFSRSNMSIAEAEKECVTYHNKWRITKTEIEPSSYVFVHQPDGSSFVDFNMYYRIKAAENNPWIEYSIDVSMLIDANEKITRIVERRIEKL